MNRLKKTSKGTYYEPSTQTEYKKENGKLIMLVPEYDIKQLNLEKRRMRRLQKKYGKEHFQGDINKINQRIKDIRQSVKDFNEGKIKKSSTVGKKIKSAEKEYIEGSYYYSNQNKEKIKERIITENKIKSVRMRGFSDINNSNAYDDLIDKGIKYFGISKEDTEKMLFPKMNEENSSYEDFSAEKINNNNQLMDILNNRQQNGELSKQDVIDAKRLFKLT